MPESKFVSYNLYEVSSLSQLSHWRMGFLRKDLQYHQRYFPSLSLENHFRIIILGKEHSDLRSTRL